MSGKIVSLIALVPMLIHSIWGCCWHHHHHAVDDRRPQLTIARASDADHVMTCQTHARHACCGSHGRPAETSTTSTSEEQHPAGTPCEEERCVYSDLSLTVLPQPVSLEAWAAVCVLVETLELPPVLLAAHSRPLDDWRALSAGELRAFKQVWLV